MSHGGIDHRIEQNLRSRHRQVPLAAQRGRSPRPGCRLRCPPRPRCAAGSTPSSAACRHHPTEHGDGVLDGAGSGVFGGQPIADRYHHRFGVTSTTPGRTRHGCPCRRARIRRRDRTPPRASSPGNRGAGRSGPAPVRRRIDDAVHGACDVVEVVDRRAPRGDRRAGLGCRHVFDGRETGVQFRQHRRHTVVHNTPLQSRRTVTEQRGRRARNVVEHRRHPHPDPGCRAGRRRPVRC